MESRFARVDHVFWKSAIFSREAMQVNHVSAHRYGDRQALGVYRIVAAVIMVILFVFLTIYEISVNKHRFYLTYAWWVSLWTLAFFAISLTNIKAYFGEKLPAATVTEDTSHPFTVWKYTTFFYTYAMMGGLHLSILTLFTTYRTYAKVELLTNIGPFLLILGDMMFNRIWMPLGQMCWFVFMDYVAAAVYSLYMAPGYPQLTPQSELDIFKMKQ